MKLLVNCDQVFDVLTRGPFPTGDASDEAVEQHLRACHDCRRLAEALRPAVALMHEAVSSDQALSLPEYQGSLPLPALDEGPEELPRHDSAGGLRGESAGGPRSLALGLRRLESQVLPPPKPPFDYAQLVNGLRLLAASVLVVALGTLAWGLLMSARNHGNVAGMQGRPAPAIGGAAAARPDEQGLRTLASLKLTPVCFPPGTRILDAAEAGTPLANVLRADELLTCCTHCHAQGKSPDATLVASNVRFAQSCSACHRG
jgi:hypothetical protein